MFIVLITSLVILAKVEIILTIQLEWIWGHSVKDVLVYMEVK